MKFDQKIILGETVKALNLPIGFQTVILVNRQSGSNHELPLAKAEFAPTVALTLKEHLVYRNRKGELSELGKDTPRNGLQNIKFSKKSVNLSSSWNSVVCQFQIID